ncbi:hypothetical protein A4A49_60949, partial [Nicotiana attenuata]
MDKLHSFSVEDYVGGMITDCVDVDVDMFSYFEFLGYVKEFGYNSSSAVIYVRPPNCPALVVIKVDRDLMGICEDLKSGDILEVYVDHMVEEAVVVPPLLEYVSQVVDDSNVTFEKESDQDLGGCEGLGTSEKASNTAENSANNSVPTAVTTDDSSNSSSESNSSESSSSTDNSSNSDHEELFEEGEADYDSKRGPDVGYAEYESRKKKSLEGKIGGDEPYYLSDEAASFETDPDDVDDEGEGEVQQKVKARRRKTKRRVIFDRTCKKIVWETGLAFASKTIVTMLEETRVKMMNRIGQLRQFGNTWITDFSPMAMKVLEENTERSMKCNIFWNGEYGFEVKQASGASEVKHLVDINRQTCTCRAWMLKGIPCAHAVAALHFKNLEPMNYISHWYSNATYMKTYSYFLQPVLGMNMWQESQNPTVIPPHVKKMPERPKKVRRKELGENKTGKLSKSGVEMTCSNCHNKGHNKRGCAKAAGSNTAATSANSVPTSVGSSKPQKQSTARGRGRPKGSKEK